MVADQVESFINELQEKTSNGRLVGVFHNGRNNIEENSNDTP